MVVGTDAHFVLAAVGPAAHFVIAEVHIAVAGVDGEVLIDVVGHAGAHVPGEVGEAVIHGHVGAAVMHVIAGIGEGKAQTGADPGGEGGIVVDVPVQVGKKGGLVPGALHAPEIAFPRGLAVAAQGEFQFRTQRHHMHGPEVVARGQRAAQGELRVLADAGTGKAAATLSRPRVLDAHQELGSKVHAFRLDQGGHGQHGKQKQGNKGAFHVLSSKKVFWCTES